MNLIIKQCVFIYSQEFYIKKTVDYAKKYEGQINIEELSKRLLVHEYGHTIPSLILGTLYLIVIGISSRLWGFVNAKKRKDEQIPYNAFFTEGWANRLGEWVTGEKSIDIFVLD